MNLFAGVCLSIKIQEEDFWDVLNWCFRVNIYLFILFDLIVCVYTCIFCACTDAYVSISGSLLQ